MGTQEFNTILCENVNYLQPFAVKLTRDVEKAQDLVQETLHRALVYKDKYQAGTNIKAWIYTIMRNIFINDYRKTKNFKIVHDASEDGYLLDRLKPEANKAVNGLGLKEVMQTIQQLPEIFRQPFMMYYEGYKYWEISELLRLPLGTIKSRIHFSRKILKEKLLKVYL